MANKGIAEILKLVDFFKNGFAGLCLFFAGHNLWLFCQVKTSRKEILLAFGWVALASVFVFLGNFGKKVWGKLEPQVAEAMATQIRKTWLNRPRGFKKRYYEHLIYKYRTHQTQGRKTRGAFDLDLEKIFVPLKLLPESASKISSTLIERQKKEGKLELWNLLEKKLDRNLILKPIAIIGGPGTGKTTLMEHICLTFAQETQGSEIVKLMPILIYLRNEREKIAADLAPSLSKLLTEQKEIQNLHLTQAWWEKQLNKDECLVMLDGLDEVADETQRQKIRDWVKKQLQNYSQAKFIITSRFGYHSAPIEDVDVLEVLPFTMKQVEEFIETWYLQTEIKRNLGKEDEGVRREAKDKSQDLMERIKQSGAITAMAVNSLLLTMIAIVYDNRRALPNRKVELYAEICDVLLERRQEAKKIPESLTPAQKKSIFQVLALELMKRKTREFKIESGIKIIRNKLLKVVGTTITPKDFLNLIRIESALLVETKQGFWEFQHQIFQEYLAAVEIKEDSQENILTSNINDPWWYETIRLYAVQSNATNLICAALTENTVRALKLALDCAEEGLSIEPEVRQQLEDKLENGLESLDREIFQIAAEVILTKRLSQFLPIDQSRAIDNSYITCAEYQLFVDEWLKSGHRFQPGSAKKPITGISRNNALGFCAWLNSKAQLNGVKKQENQGIFYRLPTKTEAQDYPAKEHKKLGCWTIERSKTGEQGIRVVKAQLSPEYIKIANYLSAEEWEKAEAEIESVMLQMLGQVPQEGLNRLSIEQISPQTLHTIELLWYQYSRGQHGWFALAVTMVNNRGRETQRKLSQARYFTEDLDNDVTLDMVYIPGGSFLMGTEDEEIERLVKKFNWDGFRREKPQHKVTFKPFFIGKYLITQAQWKAIAALPKVKRDLNPDPSRFKGDDLPVERVSWEDAIEFCQRLSKYTGKQYRLPSEAQWEYACRAGTTTPFYFGETITGELANYRASSIYANESKGEYRRKTTPVSSFPPNAFGLSHMQGNVLEWCEDNWHDNYEGAPTCGSAWKSPSNQKVIRGGSWINNPINCRSAYRSFNTRDFRSSGIGFRVVCVPPRQR